MSSFALTIFFMSYFCWWIINFLFERHWGMNPVIIKTQRVLERDKELDSKYPKAQQILMRSSRSLDAEGKYRIKTRASLHFTKVVASLVLSILSLAPLFGSQPLDIYIRLFYIFDPEVIKTNVVQAAAAVMLSWYLFETAILNQYYKPKWSLIVHHWLTSLAAILVLMNCFLPGAILYGMLLVAFTWPISLLVGLKIHYGSKYPNFIRKAHQWVYSYFIVLLFTCISLQLWMLYNGIYQESFSSLYVVTMLIACICWCYDDLNVAKVIKEGSKLNYEDLDFTAIANEESKKIQGIEVAEKCDRASVSILKKNIQYKMAQKH